MTQNLDGVVLEAIRHILHISTKVVFKQKHQYFMLDTTNSRAIFNILKYFNLKSEGLKGMKNVEYKI